jgi:hypothetical protein
MNPVQYVLWAMFAGFWICEAIAHFVLHNKSAHTVSYDSRHWAHQLTGRFAHLILAITA